MNTGRRKAASRRVDFVMGHPKTPPLQSLIFPVIQVGYQAPAWPQPIQINSLAKLSREKTGEHNLAHTRTVATLPRCLEIIGVKFRSERTISWNTAESAW